MEQKVLLANIVGFVISAIGILLYAWSIYKDKFGSWKTFVGFLIAVVGAIVTLALSGELNVLFT